MSQVLDMVLEPRIQKREQACDSKYSALVYVCSRELASVLVLEVLERFCSRVSVILGRFQQCKQYYQKFADSYAADLLCDRYCLNIGGEEWIL